MLCLFGFRALIQGVFVSCLTVFYLLYVNFARKSRDFSGDIILFVSSKRRCSVSQNFAVILICIPFTKFEKTSFTE